MRIIFFAGKGGTGKTSIAAATGIRAAEMGKKTVIMSLDVAHSLGDIFDLEKNLLDQNKGRPVQINPNLYIQEIDIQEEITRYWRDIHRYLSSLFNTTGLDEVLAEELAILPGMEEVSLLLYINQYVQREKYDVILLDCAPTGESLRFISIPATLEWYMQKIFRLERTLAKYVGPVAKRFTDVPLPDDDYFKALEELFERLKGVDQILTDPEITTVRLITNPEKVVLKETQRAFMYFCLYKMSIDAIIMNRILPEQITESYFKSWIKDQQQHRQTAEDIFSPVPILSVDLFQGEILGYAKLKKLAHQLYGKKNPLKRFYKDEPYQLVKENGNYHLKVKLPFLMKKDVELNKFSDELIIRIGGYKRNILLPRQVASKEQVIAKLKGRVLDICFEGAEDGSQKE
ncbi:MAG: TRC40/GET3/ArsA family transport-energizing ATPase [Desulfobacterales bacterium]|nr:TRC40/GET3/ArsA family transport-energizing ATPase [Desulfobacterales bacterium]